jgi:hypothetical protein
MQGNKTGEKHVKDAENLRKVYGSRNTQRDSLLFLDVYLYERDRRMVYGVRSNFSGHSDYNYLWPPSYLGVEKQKSGNEEHNKHISFL